MYKNIQELEKNFFQEVKVDTRLYRKIESCVTYWGVNKKYNKKKTALLVFKKKYNK